MEQISNIQVVPCTSSNYLKPFTVHYSQNGTKKSWDFMRTHDSVSVLIFNTSSHCFILVKQFRPAVYMCEWEKSKPAPPQPEGEQGGEGCAPTEQGQEGEEASGRPGLPPASAGVTYELCAGIVDKPDLSLEEIARQEVLEECGYDVPVNKLRRITSYRISYCTADKTQDKVFAYVSQSQFNETLECHAFLCQKKKIAQAVTLTVAQAFKVALDLWETAQDDKSKKARTCCSCSGDDSQVETEAQCVSEAENAQVLMEYKLRKPFLSSSIHSPSPRSRPARRRPVKHDSWDVEDGLDDSFSSNMEVEMEEMDTGRLANCRSRTVSPDAAVSPLGEDLMSLSSEEESN